jgi:hypothetical protein
MTYTISAANVATANAIAPSPGITVFVGTNTANVLSCGQ